MVEATLCGVDFSNGLEEWSCITDCEHYQEAKRYASDDHLAPALIDALARCQEERSDAGIAEQQRDACLFVKKAIQMATRPEVRDA